MLHDRRILELAHHLSHHSLFRIFQMGQSLARGFADLGFEEFYLLPNGHLVSKFTGEVSDLKEDQKEHFFAVPSCDEILNELLVRGFAIRTIGMDEQGRTWNVSLSDQEGNEIIGKGSSLQEALLQSCVVGVIGVSSGSGSTSGRRLRVEK